MSFRVTSFICAVFLGARTVSSSKEHSVTHPNILSDVIIPLTNSNWSLQSNDQVYTNLKARVPGDLLSDLMVNGVIDDPYIDRNFLTQAKVWIGNDWNALEYNSTVVGESGNAANDGKSEGKHIQWKRTWIYSTTFGIPENSSNEMSWKVVLEGIKMGADILINGQKIGQAIDQFLRYDFHIGDEVLQRGILCRKNIRCHNLTVSFDPSIHVNGRFSG